MDALGKWTLILLEKGGGGGKVGGFLGGFVLARHGELPSRLFT
jgi:hypothetical protein